MEINQPAAKFQDMSIAPMHTVEHILNQTMVRMFGCERSRNAHIERKKSKCDYTLPCAPAEGWGWLIEQGFSILETNYPKDLIEYLKSEKRH